MTYDEALEHWMTARNYGIEYERLRAWAKENPDRTRVCYTDCHTRAPVGATVHLFNGYGPVGEVLERNQDGTARVGAVISEVLEYLEMRGME